MVILSLSLIVWLVGIALHQWILRLPFAREITKQEIKPDNFVTNVEEFPGWFRFIVVIEIFVWAGFWAFSFISLTTVLINLQEYWLSGTDVTILKNELTWISILFGLLIITIIFSLIVLLLVNSLFPKFSRYFAFTPEFYQHPLAQSYQQKKEKDKLKQLWNEQISQYDLNKLVKSQWRGLIQYNRNAWILGGILVVLGMNTYTYLKGNTLVNNPIYYPVEKSYQTQNIERILVDSYEGSSDSSGVRPIKFGVYVVSKEGDRIGLLDSNEIDQDLSAVLLNYFRHLAGQEIIIEISPEVPQLLDSRFKSESTLKTLLREMISLSK